jgi:hypothetical protein
MNTKTDCINALFGSLTRTSRWRESMKKKYPSDPRNGRAALALARLADESRNLGRRLVGTTAAFSLGVRKVGRRIITGGASC